MKILHVIPSISASTGGPAFNTVALCRKTEELGFQTTIVTTDARTSAQASSPLNTASVKDFPEGAQELDVRIFSLAHPYRFAYSPALGRHLREAVGSYDVVHIHSVNLYPQLAAWKAANRAGVPVVLSPRGALDPWVRGKRRWIKYLNDLFWQREMFDRVAIIHLTSEDERRLIEPMKLLAPTVVIPNGFDVASFSKPGNPVSFRNRWLNGYSGRLILNHGRLSEKKGLDVLVDALLRIREILPVRLALVGADEEGVGDQLRAQSERIGLREAITFVPPLAGDDLLDAIAAADVWVLPSHTENFGMAVVEAMAAGKPVVTSPYVNIAPEAEEEDALIMVPNNGVDVADAVLEVLTDGSKSRALIAKARLHVQRYDWSHEIFAYERMYRDAVEKTGSQRSP